MRVFVACDEESRRLLRVAALERLGVDVAGASDLARLALDVRATRPDVLLLEGVATGQAARDALRRARRAVEGALGAVLLLPAGATWLRVPPPPDVQPVVVLPGDAADDGALRRAIDRLRATARVPDGEVSAYGLTLDRRSREARTDEGRVALTESEARILGALLEERSRVLRSEELARALYGRVLNDPRTRAAVRAHVASLRRRLAELEVDEQVEGLRGVGYRFVERRGPRVPPRR